MSTPNLSAEAFASLGGPNLVYVRPVSGAEIIASTPVDQLQGFQHNRLARMNHDGTEQSQRDVEPHAPPVSTDRTTTGAPRA